jgi:hypothetical protein
VAAAIGVGGDIRDSVRGGGGGGNAALRMRTKRMEPRLPQLAPRRGQTLSGGGLMGEINRSVEKMSIGDNSSGGGGSMMANQLGGGGGEGSSGMTALLSAGGKLRGGGGTVPPQSTLLQNTGSSR